MMKKNQSFLLVDADQMLCHHIRNEMLLRGRRHIEFATDIEEAMQLASRQHFDTVLIDLFMSKLSSLQLAKYLQRKHADTHIILLIKEEYQPVLDGELDLPVLLKKDLLSRLF